MEPNKRFFFRNPKKGVEDFEWSQTKVVVFFVTPKRGG